MTTSTNKCKPSKLSRGLSFNQCLLYSSPVIAINFLMGPIGLVHNIYAKYFGIGLTTIAAILLIARVFDAITDPLIGYLSDRYHTRTGSRKPFVVGGALLLIISSYFLFVPTHFAPFQSIGPSDIGDVSVSSAYFLMALLAFYLTWTIFEIPHLAWASELAPKAMDKNKVYTLRATAGFIGMLLFYGVPLLPLFDSQEITPQTLQWAFLIAVVLTIPLLFICFRYVPNNEQAEGVINSDKPKRERFSVLLVLIFGNKPLLLFIAAALLLSTGVAMMMANMFFLVDSYLGIGGQFAQTLVIGLLASVISLGCWYRLLTFLGKKACWVLCMLLITLSALGFCQLTPGPNNFGLVAVMLVMSSSAAAGAAAIAPSLLSDIIDYDTWKSGTDRAATYFSLYTLTAKSSAALGGALALAVAGGFGFDATATQHSEMHLLGLHLAMGYIPAVFFLLSVIFMLLNPINERRHTIIRHRLDARETHVHSNAQQPEEAEDSVFAIRLHQARADVP